MKTSTLNSLVVDIGLALVLVCVVAFPFAMHAASIDTVATSTATNMNVKLQNPIGTKTIQDFLVKILNAVVQILTPVLVLMFIWTGFKFVQAQGQPEAIEKAKQSLIWLIVGAAIIIGAKGIALAISSTLSQI